MCSRRDPPKETDFFKNAVESTSLLLLNHKICKDRWTPVVAFYMYLSKLYGGYSAYLKIEKEQWLNLPDNMKCLAIFEKYKGSSIVGEWMLGDHKSFYGNPVTEALLILGDLVVNPKRMDNYTDAPIVIQDFTEVMEFSIEYMNEMHPIIYEFIEELQKYSKKYEYEDRIAIQTFQRIQKRHNSGCLTALLTIVSCVSLTVFLLFSLLL